MLFNRPGKLNHLHAVFHEAISELDKMSGTVSTYFFFLPPLKAFSSPPPPPTPPPVPSSGHHNVSIIRSHRGIVRWSSPSPRGGRSPDSIECVAVSSSPPSPPSLQRLRPFKPWCDLSSNRCYTWTLSGTAPRLDWPQKVLETPITNTVLTVEEEEKKRQKNCCNLSTAHWINYFFLV